MVCGMDFGNDLFGKSVSNKTMADRSYLYSEFKIFFGKYYVF